MRKILTRNTTAILLALAAAPLGYLFLHSYYAAPMHLARDKDASPTSIETYVSGRAGGPGSWAFRPVHLSPVFSQSIGSGSDLDSQNPTDFALRETSKTGPGLLAQRESVFLYRAPYAITDVASAKRDRFYLIGRYPNGDDCIESWKPCKVLQSQSGTIHPPRMKRAELYRGTTLGSIMMIGADPQERYLLLVHGDGPSVCQMDIATGAITPLFDATSVPELASMEHIAPWLHAIAGRIWILESPDIANRILLFDPEDDGSINSWRYYDATAWIASGYDNLANWVDDYQH